MGLDTQPQPALSLIRSVAAGEWLARREPLLFLRTTPSAQIARLFPICPKIEVRVESLGTNRYSHTNRRRRIVVYSTALERRHAERHREFESRRLRFVWENECVEETGPRILVMHSSG